MADELKGKTLEGRRNEGPHLAKMMERAGVDRLGALNLAIELVRRGGTISLSGVHGGEASPMPLLTMFDKQIKLRMGQANVKHWIDDIMPLLTGDDDPLGVEDFATHRVPLEEAPNATRCTRRRRTAPSRSFSSPHPCGRVPYLKR